MTTCGSCWGSGKVTCPGCGGRRHKARLTASGDMDINLCIVCGGTGKTRCNFCGGRGTVGPAVPVNRPPKRPTPKTDALAGRWYDTQGNYYEIAKDRGNYRVTEHGALGQCGTGTATRSGDLVTLDMTNVLFGRYSMQLRLDGESLQGATSMMGMRVPIMFTRG